MTAQSLIGRTFRFHYDTDIYRIEVLDATRARWTNEADGRCGVEDYGASHLNADTVMISWVEADGLRVSNVLDFAAMAVATHTSSAREVFVNPGRLSLG